MIQPVRYRAELRLPAQGATETEAVLIQWYVGTGDAFTVGDRLAQAESGKSVFDFEAPCTGRVVRLHFAANDVVPLDKPVLTIETDDPAVRPWAVTLTPVGDIPEENSRAGSESIAESVTDSVSATKPGDGKPMDATMQGRTTCEHAVSSVRAAGGDAVFLGFGSELPSRIVENDELLGPFPDIDSEYIYKVTGVRRRRWAAPEESPSDLGERAARRAIDDAQKNGVRLRGAAEFDVSSIDAIIVATVTPDVAMPSTACILASKLGLSGIPAMDLNAACCGWLYAVGVARGLIATGVARCVLTVGVDLQSRLLDPYDRSTVFLFGDGAGAAILAAEDAVTCTTTEKDATDNDHPTKAGVWPRLRWVQLGCDSSGITWARRMFPGDCIPCMEHGSQGVDPWVRMDGTEIFRAASRAMIDQIRAALSATGWQPDELARIIPHQANARILRVIEKQLSLPAGILHSNLAETGNVAGGSIPVSLCGLKSGLRRGDKLIFCAAGAGLTTAAAAVEW